MFCTNHERQIVFVLFEELVEQFQVQNWYKTHKSTNNQTLFFELLEEIMDPSHILLL